MQKWTLLPIFIDIERDQAYNTCYYKPYIPHSKVELHYLVGLSREEAAARVAGLQPDSLVLYLSMLRDGDGQISGPAAPSLRTVAASSSVPVLLSSLKLRI